ncbi:MAG TPA: FAD-dependent monooxygenase, partial [Candidatus Manganitrophaceae bacterium]|nr:FAD-dependent monooxygenase [Candidatus Manganitrophaceae bacterium]
MVHYDVVVVGMGPAGALAAFELSRLGRRVLAIEQAPFPQFKISGGVLTVRASKLIPFDFSGEIEQVIHGVTLNLRGEARFTFESPRPIAYTLSRDRFDFLLVSKAKESGALVLDKVSLLDWVEEEDQVRVFTSMGEWRCDYLIGADGANSL